MMNTGIQPFGARDTTAATEYAPSVIGVTWGTRALTLSSGWTEASTGDAPVRAVKDIFGIVRLYGRLTTTGAGAAAFYLPTGWRPRFVLRFKPHATAWGANDWLAIDSTGAVAQGTAAAATINLDGIAFQAEV